VLAKVWTSTFPTTPFPFPGTGSSRFKDTIFVRPCAWDLWANCSYELHVPSSYMQAVWDMLKRPEPNSASATSAWKPRTCCAWKNATSSSAQESEQRTNLLDVGLGFLWDRKKADARTVGAVALRQAENDVGRLKLVGIRMEDDTARPRRRPDCRQQGARLCGHHAQELHHRRSVGMALVESQLADKGTRLEIFEDECNGVRLYARVIDMPFYDPKGERMKN
jgi:sarcosine oxidase subunit alpha